MARRLLIACLLCCASIFSASAQPSLALAPDVEAVVTGGWWQSPQGRGTYRVVIRTAGFDHIISEAYVDWIAETRGRDEPARVVTSTRIETGSWRLLHPRFEKRSNQWHVLIPAVETHFNPPVHGTWRIDLGKPGEARTTLLKK